MCERLSEIRSALSCFAAAFEPATLSADEAGRVVADAAAVEASAAAVKALAAARAADAGAYGRGHEQSVVAALAEAVGVGSGTARELIATGRRLVDQPRVAAAAKSGVLSPAKVALVANAAAADPAAAGHLVELAGRSSVPSLREECARVKAAVGDAEQRRRAIRARRRLSAWTDVEGVWHLAAQGNPEDGAQVMAALSPLVEARFRAARLAGERESPAAYAFDALVDLAREAASSDGGDTTGQPSRADLSGAAVPAGARSGAVRTDDDDATAGVGADRARGAPSGLVAGGAGAGAGGGPGGAGLGAGGGAGGAVVGAGGGAGGAGLGAGDGAGGAGLDAGGGGASGAGLGAGDGASGAGLDAGGGAGGPPAQPVRAPAAADAGRGGGRRRRGAPVKLLVRIDYDTFLRGASREGETCELVGYGPIAVSAVHELLETGDPFVAAILTKGKALVGVAHLGRRARAAELSALQWLYPSCAVRGCTAQARLEVDHRIDWAATHYTAFDLLDRLCHRHHALKTREHWALVAGTGKRQFVAPTDPRHPRHARAPATA